MSDSKVCIVGGCGHVGLPLGLALARAGLDVAALDLNSAAVEAVNAGRMPFVEEGGPEVLAEVLAAGTFRATTRADTVGWADVVIVVIGTGIDEHLSPDPLAVPDAIEAFAHHLRDDQLIVLRSTIFPGVSRIVHQRLRRLGHPNPIAFCPERIAQGLAFTELYTLPQIVSGTDAEAVERASALFRRLTSGIVEAEPEEAELAKLFTNTWRYIKFAAANQFFMIANGMGVDYDKVRSIITEDYPRAVDLPGAGFAAGPCLLKDTMQLAASDNGFLLGHTSMMVNEGLPMYVVERMALRFPLEDKVVGILGMSFKGGSDDIRSSLAYRLKRILRARCADVLCHDDNVEVDSTLVDLDTVLSRADILVIGAPHPEYRDLRTDKPVIDIWNVTGRGVLV